MAKSDRNPLMTREELAECVGVGPLTIDMWESQGMRAWRGDSTAPSRQGRKGRAGAAEPSTRRSWQVSRNDLAAAWEIHADTLSKWMREGLGAAIVRRGAKGEVFLDERVATRWKCAYEGKLNNMVLDDFKAYAHAGVFALHALSGICFLNRQPEDK